MIAVVDLHNNISDARPLPSSGSSGRVRGTRNMKSMQVPSATIFFMTYFHRARGWGMAPSVPSSDPLLLPLPIVFMFMNFLGTFCTKNRSPLPDLQLDWTSQFSFIFSNENIRMSENYKIVRSKGFLWSSKT